MTMWFIKLNSVGSEFSLTIVVILFAAETSAGGGESLNTSITLLSLTSYCYDLVVWIPDVPPLDVYWEIFVGVLVILVDWDVLLEGLFIKFYYLTFKAGLLWGEEVDLINSSVEDLRSYIFLIWSLSSSLNLFSSFLCLNG